VTEEKRQSPRFPCTLKVRCALLSRIYTAESSHFTLEGVTENIGKGGFAVLTSRLIPVRSVLRCELSTGAGPVGVPTLAEVRWSSPIPEKRLYRLGLQFLL
jgi:hypothetical protein